MMTQFYRILGLRRGAPLSEIKEAFDKMARRFPPERFPEQFMRASSAYEALTLSGDSVDSVMLELCFRDTVVNYIAGLFGDLRDPSLADDDLESLSRLVESPMPEVFEAMLRDLPIGEIEYRRTPCPGEEGANPGFWEGMGAAGHAQVPGEGDQERPSGGPLGEGGGEAGN